jgi:transcription termination/antitermination protein NusG
LDWYALFVASGCEEKVQKWLNLQFDPSDIYSIVPKRLLPEKRAGQFFPVLRKVFPGYVFIRTCMNVSTYYRLKEIPGIYCILSTPGTYYTKIQEEEMSTIMQFLDQEDIVGYSTLQIKNNRPIVKKGPLIGKEHSIRKIDKRKRRAKILITLLGEPKLIDLGIEIIESPSDKLKDCN